MNSDYWDIYSANDYILAINKASVFGSIRIYFDLNRSYIEYRNFAPSNKYGNIDSNIGFDKNLDLIYFQYSIEDKDTETKRYYIKVIDVHPNTELQDRIVAQFEIHKFIYVGWKDMKFSIEKIVYYEDVESFLMIVAVDAIDLDTGEREIKKKSVYVKRKLNSVHLGKNIIDKFPDTDEIAL